MFSMEDGKLGVLPITSNEHVLVSMQYYRISLGRWAIVGDHSSQVIFIKASQKIPCSNKPMVEFIDKVWDMLLFRKLKGTIRYKDSQRTIRRTSSFSFSEIRKLNRNKNKKEKEKEKMKGSKTKPKHVYHIYRVLCKQKCKKGTVYPSIYKIQMR